MVGVAASGGENGGPQSMLGRGLSLLTVFRPGDDELTLAELSRRSGIHKPTAHRLVAELVAKGFLERTPSALRLGMRLFEIGQLAPLQRGIREAAAPYLADLLNATDETVHLAVLDQLDVVYLQKVDGSRAPAVPSRIGGRMPAHATAVGKAILAHSPYDRFAAVVATSPRRLTPRTIVAPGLLARELARIRERGFAEEHEEAVVGVACVAAAVIGESGYAIAALSITGWANKLDTDRLGPAVRTASLGFSRLIGRSAGTPPAESTSASGVDHLGRPGPPQPST